MLLFSMAGCDKSPSNPNTPSGGTKGGKLRIAVIPKGTSHQFWRSVHAGAEAAAKELGNVEVLWKGPETEADTSGQISVVKNFITNRVDGIVLAPNHSQSLMDVVSEANAENIPVVIFDSGLGKGGPGIGGNRLLRGAGRGSEKHEAGGEQPASRRSTHPSVHRRHPQL